MIKKSTSLTIHQNRSVTTFFNRITEQFERKFDGFPAVQLEPRSTPALQEGSSDYDGVEIDVGDIIGDFLIDPSVLPCPQLQGPEHCTEGYSNGCIETFTRSTANGWGTSEIVNPTTGAPLIWQPTDSDLSTNGTQGVISGPTSPASLLFPSAMNMPQEFLIHWKFRDTHAFPLSGSYHLTGGLQVNLQQGADIADLDVFYDPTANSQLRGALTINYPFDELAWNIGTAVGGAAQHTERITEGYFRIRISATGTYAKAWRIEEGEPSAWDAELAAPSSPLRSLQLDSTAGSGPWYFESVGIVEGMECSYTECDELPTFESGTTLVNDFIATETGSYKTNTEISHITQVWYDDLLAVKDIDYSVNDENEIVPLVPLDDNVAVRGQYIV
jgi:hypothetical protein